MVNIPLAQPNCRRCWMPLAHCACAPREGDLVWLGNAYPGLMLLRIQAQRGDYSGDDDRRNTEQQRWAFLLWLVAHGMLAME